MPDDFQLDRVLARARAGAQLSRTEARILVQRAPLALVDVEPLRYEETGAYVHRASGCRLETVRVPVFPEAHRAYGLALRDRRVGADLPLHDAAPRLGLRVVELAALERGAARWAEPAIAEAVMAAAWCGS